MEKLSVSQGKGSQRSGSLTIEKTASGPAQKQTLQTPITLIQGVKYDSNTGKPSNEKA